MQFLNGPIEALQGKGAARQTRQSIEMRCVLDLVLARGDLFLHVVNCCGQPGKLLIDAGADRYAVITAADPVCRGLNMSEWCEYVS